MKKEFFIRAARNEDCEQVRKIIFNILLEYGLKPDPEGKDKDLDDIEENYFNHQGFFGVAVDRDKNEILGTFGIVYTGTGTCELRKMYVMKNARGKGIGKVLLNTAIEIAKRKKYNKIVLETISPLKEAIAMYKKYGFTETMPLEVNKRCDMAFELIIS
jgi:GNAT superfamily N-acetyltransferase